MTDRCEPDHDRQNQQGDDMSNQDQNDKMSRSIELPSNASDYPSALHRELNLTDQDVEDDLRARGTTARAVVDGFDRMVAGFKARTETRRAPDLSSALLRIRIEQTVSPSPAEAEFDDSVDGLESLRFYEESVAAGVPGGDGGDVPYRKARRSDFFGNQDWGSVFLAKVSGWSMREDHITDGDMVLVDGKARPRDGDIVLACIVGQGQVVKRLRLIDGDQIVLESANPDFAPIVIDDPERVAIRGVVRGRAGKV